MGIMAQLHWDIFSEPGPESDYVKMILEEEKEREVYFWEVQCQAWPIDTREKELLVKDKCARVAERLQAKKDR